MRAEHASTTQPPQRSRCIAVHRRPTCQISTYQRLGITEAQSVVYAWQPSRRIVALSAARARSRHPSRQALRYCDFASNTSIDRLNLGMIDFSHGQASRRSISFENIDSQHLDLDFCVCRNRIAMGPAKWGEAGWRLCIVPAKTPEVLPERKSAWH